MDKPLSGIYLADIKSKYKDRVYITHLVRRSYRENGKVKQQTLANLTRLPAEAVELVRQYLKGARLVPIEERLNITRTLPHGHVAAVRAMLRKLDLHHLIASRPSRERNLCEAMIVARVVASRSKLATNGWWSTTTLAEDLGLEDATTDEMYKAMDWLLKRKRPIEDRLAKRHLGEHALVLYDLTAVTYEGATCPLAAFGRGKSGRKGKREIVFGLIADKEGRPIAVDVYRGNTGDPVTVKDQADKVKNRFNLQRVIMVGDRGVLTQARIEALKKLGGIDWITALRAPTIRKLMDQGTLQLSLFDEQDLAEITSPDFPGERLVACRNPMLAEERARKREELLQATEKLLDGVTRKVASGRLKAKEKIGIEVGKVINKHKVAKHFEVHIADGRFRYARKEASIRREAAMDGIYVLRTPVSSEELSAEQVVLSYKQLSVAEQAFRTYKSIDLKVTPIHHRLDPRVRAHIFLCTLAYYVEWHLRKVWAPYLFEDEAPGRHLDDSPVKAALRSPEALRKAATKTAADGFPVLDFQTLLDELGTVARNRACIPALPTVPPFTIVTTPTAYQQRLLELAGLRDIVGDRNSRQNQAR